MSDFPTTRAGQDLRQLPSRRSFRIGAFQIALGALASYAIFRAAANGGAIAARTADVADAVCYAVVDLCLIAFSYLAARSARAEPATWRAWLFLMAASMLSATASNASTLSALLHRGAATPSWSDSVFAVSYVLTIAGLLSFPIAQRRRPDRIMLSFDIATVVLSGTMIFWYWCVRVGAFERSTTLATMATVVGYPTADLTVLMTAAILLVRATDSRARTIFGLVTVGTFLSTIGDFWYGFLDANHLKYQRSTIIDVCWLGGILFLGVAAASQLRRSARRDTPHRVGARWMAEIPLIAIALAFAMLFLAIRDNRDDVEAQLGAGALLLTILAIARQRISAREAARLMNERAIRDERFRALVQNSSDVVVVLDASLRATYVSPAIDGVLGRDSEQGVGQSFLDWVAPDDRVEVSALLARIATTPSAAEPLRCRMVHADGTLRVMETLATNLLEDPSVRGVVLNSRDITRRTVLEEQLQHAQKLEIVGQLAGGIAHDFNNLLMVIGANAEFVLSDDSDPAATRAAASEIKDTTTRAAALTKQLLSFSRKQVSRPVIINPNDIVRHVERMLLRLMQHAAHVETELTDSPSCIEIDPGQLEQALLNLAVNSRDSMPIGGLLRMRTRVVKITERRTVDRGTLVPGEYVAISVEDNGAGMRAEVRRRIFEPFFTTKPIGSGTGLGLAMVLAVVHQSGGQVEVTSAHGEGTCITLYFPLVAGSVLPGNRPGVLVHRGEGRILVVDDEEGVRTVVQRLLVRIGYEVDAVGDANTALAMLAGSPPRFDLVVTDILMPGKTGLELATELIEKNVPVAIVLMTGFADSATVREASQTHRLPILKKPFEAEQLATIVEQALAGSYPRPSAE